MASFMVYIDDHVYYLYNSFRKVSRKLGRKEVTQNKMAIGVAIGGGGDIKSYFLIHVVSAIYDPLTVRYPILVNNRVQFGK